MDQVWNVLWILFLVSAFMPWIQTRLLQGARLRSLRRLEVQRGSRVITLIHRQESRTLLGIPVVRFIDIDDSERILRAIRLTRKDMPIDFVSTHRAVWCSPPSRSPGPSRTIRPR
jgi:ClpP class serine protease